MAQNTTLTIAEGSWTQLTNADVTSITFQVKSGGPVSIAVTAGAVAPSDFSGAVEYGEGEGEINVSIAALAPGLANPTRVYAFSHGGPSQVFVSHA